MKREVAIAQFVGGRYEEAIVNLQQVVATDPDFTYAANLLARALTFAGRPEEAIAIWESRPQQGDWERWLMPAYVKLGRRADVNRLLNLPRNAHPYRQALNYAALGDKERTFEALVARRRRCPSANRCGPGVPGDVAASRRSETRSAPKAIQPSVNLPVERSGQPSRCGERRWSTAAGKTRPTTRSRSVQDSRSGS